MKIESGKNQFVVSLVAAEVFRIQAGQIVGERGGFLIDSKIEVAPLSGIQEDQTTELRHAPNRLNRGQSEPLIGHLLGNGDLRVYVPDVVLRDVRIAERTLKPDQIAVITGPQEMIQIVPKDGVKICFGGSLQRIDVPSAFINATS